MEEFICMPSSKIVYFITVFKINRLFYKPFILRVFIENHKINGLLRTIDQGYTNHQSKVDSLYSLIMENGQRVRRPSEIYGSL